MKRIFSVAVSILLIVMTFVSCSDSIDFEYDYRKKNLDKYLELDPSFYTGVSVQLDKKFEVTDEDVEDAINDFLLKKRESVAAGVTTTHIGVSDIAYIYYWGEYKDDHGQYVQFSGGSNWSDSSPYMLTIGSGSFINGFEDQLVGHAAIETTYSAIDTTKGRIIGANSVVYLNIMNYSYTDGNKIETGKYDSFRLDLANPGIYAPLAEKLVGKKIGDPLDFGYTVNWDSDYIPLDWDKDGENEQLRISGTIAGISEQVRTVDLHVTFPEEYQDETLEGKEAVFHVAITKVDDYRLPELTEELIKGSYADFALAEGKELKAAFSEYMKASLIETAAENRRVSIENKIWTYLLENAPFTGKYPKKAMKVSIAEIDLEMQSEYEYYNSQYQQQYGSSIGTFEEFASIRYATSEKTWQQVRDERATDLTREQLLLYVIAKNEGWLLTDEEYAAGRDKIVKQYMDQYENLTEDIVIEHLGEPSIYNTVLYEKVVAKLSALANVKEAE